MKKFRLGALTLAAVLLLTAFTSCNDSEDSKGTESKSDNGTEISGTTADGDGNNSETVSVDGSVGEESTNDSSDNGTEISDTTPDGDGNTSGIASVDGSEGLKYKLISDGTAYTVFGFEEKSENYFVVVPDMYNGLPVTSIGEDAFEFCTGLISITIPDSIISIDYHAFYECTGLTSIMVPGSVAWFDKSSLYGCTGLESITVSENNEHYYSSGNCLIKTSTNTLVAGCKKSVIPDSVIRIDNNAFGTCEGLINITIPSSVTFIGKNVFGDCTGLESITVSENNEHYYSSENCLIETSTNTLIAGCKNSIIPIGVTSIDEWAFKGCTGLTSISIPNSVTSIGSYAFAGCTGLTSITIPNSVTSICGVAFSGCTELTSITIPDSVTSIGFSAFYKCTGLTSISIPNSVTSIGEYAFENCTGLTSVVFENTTGWSVEGTAVDVSAPATNATYLTDTYYRYTWSRS